MRPLDVVRKSIAPAITTLGLACFGAAGAEDAASGRGREPVVGLPCEGCEAVFVGLPETLESTARIAPADEPGEPLRIEGIVFDHELQPVPGVIVYAYHTDAHGIYPRDPATAGTIAARHGRLRGWAKTDEQGRYRFDTIRPAGYPSSSIPQHVHMHVIEPGCCTYYLEDVHFTDDPRLTERDRARMAAGRGGPGLVTPEKDADGVWVATRDIRLGEGVPGHPRETPARER